MSGHHRQEKKLLRTKYFLLENSERFTLRLLQRQMHAEKWCDHAKQEPKINKRHTTQRSGKRRNGEETGKEKKTTNKERKKGKVMLKFQVIISAETAIH